MQRAVRTVLLTAIRNLGFYYYSRKFCTMRLFQVGSQESEEGMELPNEGNGIRSHTDREVSYRFFPFLYVLLTIFRSVCVGIDIDLALIDPNSSTVQNKISPQFN
jgi:hypothetical protein